MTAAAASGPGYGGGPAGHPDLVAVLGASGRSGADLCRAMSAAGMPFVPVVRDQARWRAVGLPEPARLADLADFAALAAALADARTVVSTAHASWTPQIIAAAPPDAGLVLMGSTRRFSQWPDAHGDGVRAGEAALLASGRAGVMLHPTLIYGLAEQGDVQRLAALLAKLPLAPLPAGGQALVQPIHQSDVTRCLLAAINQPWARPETVVIAGPEPMAYRSFLAAVAAAAGLRAPPILPLPAMALRALARVGGLVPGLPRIDADAIRRLTEDRAFDIGRMRDCLGVDPVPLSAGLAMTFPCRRDAA